MIVSGILAVLSAGALHFLAEISMKLVVRPYAFATLLLRFPLPHARLDARVDTTLYWVVTKAQALSPI